MLLGLPAQLFGRDAARAAVFEGVHWSSSDTCSSQSEALRRAGLHSVVVGPTYHDCDEVEDVMGLEQRLRGAAAATAARLPHVGTWLGRLREALG